MAFWNKDTEASDDLQEEAKEIVTEKPAPRKKEKNNMARDDRQSGEMNALLGKGARFEGKLTFEGTVRVDGIFKGEIISEDVLIIGETAKVEAEVRVGTAIVNGEVNGNITAVQAVQLHNPAKVRGNLCTPSLLIEKGVIFEGSCTMESGSRKTLFVPKNEQPQPEKK